MAERVTEEGLERAVKDLNIVFGYKRKYVKSKAEYIGKEFVIGQAYGGYRLELAGRGIRDISPRGTKQEVYNFIQAFAEGIYMYKTRKNKR